jgi:hypothetical protein
VLLVTSKIKFFAFSFAFKRKKLLELMEHFNITICIEDDPRNIEMMKELGLTVLEVN